MAQEQLTDEELVAQVEQPAAASVSLDTMVQELQEEVASFTSNGTETKVQVAE